MKKVLKYIAFLGIALAIPFSSAWAQNVKTTDKVEAKEVEQIEQPLLKDQPLSVRKQKVEADLKFLIVQFNFLYNKTQGTIDRLSTKSIDTKESQTELDLGIIALNSAKDNLSLFSKIVISETTPGKSSPELKLTAKNTEEALRESKLRLINALSILKIQLSTSN